VRVLGHRGSRRPGPENTPLAVAAALDAGADGVEVDVRRGPGGGLVVCHDPLPAAQTGGPARPAVVEVLAAARGRGSVVLEVKADREPDVAAVVRDLAALLDPADDVVVSSFDPAAVAAARGLGLRTGLLTGLRVGVATGLAQAVAGGHPELHAHLASVRLDRHAGRRCRDAGVELVTWTLSRPAGAPRLAAAGVDAVIADDPAAVVAILR